MPGCAGQPVFAVGVTGLAALPLRVAGLAEADQFGEHAAPRREQFRRHRHARSAQFLAAERAAGAEQFGGAGDAFAKRRRVEQ